MDGRPQTYRQLSEAYQLRTGDWFHWHGSWDEPLGELNQRLAMVGAPAISALVILQDQNEPGARFWGSAHTVPSRPKSDSVRIEKWTAILNDVRTYQWPQTLSAYGNSEAYSADQLARRSTTPSYCALRAVEVKWNCCFGGPRSPPG